MENHGQQGARHSGAALGPAAAGVAGRAFALAPSEARPAALARHTDLTGAPAASAPAHHRRESRRAGTGAGSLVAGVLLARPPRTHGRVSRVRAAACRTTCTSCTLPSASSSA